MPDLTAPPTATDIELLLKSAAYWPTDPVKIALAQEQAAIGAMSATDEWENRTGWHPFLSTGDDEEGETRTFVVERDMIYTRGIVPLDAGLLRFDSLSLDGTPIVAPGICPMPSTALYRKQPYSWLKLPLHRYYGNIGLKLPVQVSVTGRWGYCTTLPADAWQAMQQAAALIALVGVENLQSIASIGMDGFNKALDTVGILTQKDIAQQWGKNFVAVSDRYQRKVLY